jgi:thiamine biosynthesis lipoprotein
MGMPITVEIVDAAATPEASAAVFGYFDAVDRTFSTYKADSEISRLNRKEITFAQAGAEVQTILALAEQTRQETDGYFDIWRNGTCDPSGIVKGWAIYHAAEMLRRRGFENFYIDAGGDIEAVGKNSRGQNWRVGIRNPFNLHEIVKTLAVSNCGVATSGTDIRGQHIYNPKNAAQSLTDILSLTVIGPNVYEADRFATAAFAMGREGIYFIERLVGFEGYMIDRDRRATFTSGFSKYVYTA